MDDQKIQFIYYTDDAIIVTENEDDFQRLPHVFKIIAKKFNRLISVEKTMEEDGETIKQKSSFVYTNDDFWEV